MKFADKIKEARKEKDLAIALMLEDEKGFDEFLKAVQQSLIDEKNKILTFCYLSAIIIKYYVKHDETPQKPIQQLLLLQT